jgi:tetratricopeptide (TPR) repeat protein
MNHKYIILFILSLTLTSCSDFLDIEPETSITTSNFFKTQADFEQAVAGIYEPLRAIYNDDWGVNEMRSDNTFFMFDVANRGSKPVEDLATYTLENNNRILLPNWQNHYKIITRANEVLHNLENTELDPSVEDGFKGEAYFLRAFAYFNLAKNFGGVPLTLEPVKAYEETFLARAPLDDVYAQIISDASSAVSFLPSKENQDAGKATSGAALTLLADIYVTLKRWGEAESTLKTVVGMGYSLLDDYGSIFDPSNWNNDELIFQIEYIDGNPQNIGSTFPYDFLPVLVDPSILTGVGPGIINNDGSFNVPTPDIIEAYEDIAADMRYDASIAFYSGESPLVGVTYDNTPYVKKFAFFHSDPEETSTNWPIYRYGEVLLLLAESLNEQGKSGEALPYLNQIRDRAGLEDISAANQAELRELIYHERRIELAFENKRWHDLVRTDRAVSIMNAHGEKVKAEPAKYYYPAGSTPFANSFTVTEQDEVYPIPINEINVNPLLEQNPGY